MHEMFLETVEAVNGRSAGGISLSCSDQSELLVIFKAVKGVIYSVNAIANRTRVFSKAPTLIFCRDLGIRGES
jgi:hypothetical protein